VCNSASNASRFVGQIRAHCESNEVLLGLYPGLGQPATGQWSNEAFTISGRTKPFKEPSVSGKGAGSSVVSGHYTKVICDDLIDIDDVTTEDQLRKKIEWFDNALLPCCDDQIHIRGTRWHMADLYGIVLERNKRSNAFSVRIDKALYGSAGSYTVLWPDGPANNCSVDALLNLKLENPQAFALQRQNEPCAGPLAKFRQEWFRYDTHRPNPRKIYFQGVDFSAFGEKKTSDWFVIATIGLLDTVVTVEDVYRVHQPTFREQAQAILAQIDKWKPLACGLESVQYQKAMYQVLSDVGPKYASVLRQIKCDRDKVVRSIRLSNAYEAGRVIHPSAESAPWLADLELELMQFPLGEHDDQVDALAHAANLAFDMEKEVMEVAKVKDDGIEAFVFANAAEFVF
ncbi:MAG TPA: hypothetical protein VM223_02335, partial [Planctomycetota bacterium]|nr:hypothetical protein [Planctomycetota bacterium]